MKTKLQRMREIRHLMEQLERLGLGPHIPAIEEFKDITAEYIRTGRGIQGAIPLPGTGRVIVFELEEKQNKVSNVVLKYMP